MKIARSNIPVAENLQRIIHQKGLKQCVIAEKSNLSVQMLNDMLNGRRIIKASDIVDISKALEISPNELFKQSDSA